MKPRLDGAELTRTEKADFQFLLPRLFVLSLLTFSSVLCLSQQHLVARRQSSKLQFIHSLDVIRVNENIDTVSLTNLGRVVCHHPSNLK